MKNDIISYNFVIKQIEFYFNQIEDWAEMQMYDYVSAFTERATSLIELLETNNCGSIGGFDKNVNGFDGIVEYDQQTFDDYPEQTYKFVHKKLWKRYYWLKEVADY